MGQSRTAAGAWGRGLAMLFSGLATCGLGGVPAPAAQGPPPAEGGAAQAATDPGVKYRFLERYATPTDPPNPQEIGQYLVGMNETIKQATENGQRTPDRTERKFRTIYSERAARVSIAGEVTDAVRRYHTFHSPDEANKDATKKDATRPLQGLTLWYHPGVGPEPQILNLTEGREFYETDYTIASRQIFLPNLRGLLPTLPSQVGETWKIPRASARALLGEQPGGGPGLAGKLMEVRKNADGSKLVAVIGISGQVFLPTRGDSSVNAEVLFTFAPPGRLAGPGATINAQGAITELRMALRSMIPRSDDPDERLRILLDREVVLQRRLADANPALTVPNPPPAPTEANSWLTYNDRVQGRFHFHHPQDLRQMPPPGPGAVVLQRQNASGGPDVLTLTPGDKMAKPTEDKEARDPELQQKRLKKEWEEEGLEVVQLNAGSLPEDEWADSKLKVHRIRATLKPSQPDTKGPQRVYYDFYLATYGRNDYFTAVAMTVQDPPLFLKEAEAILKSFRTGDSRPPASK